MYNGLVHLHSVLRWIILILLVVVLFQSFTKGSGIKKTSLWLMIAAHITLVLGLYQWLTGNWGLKLFQSGGMKDVMSSNVYRFWGVEHITGMLIAIVLITIARGKAKQFNYKATSWLYLFAFIIIIAVIPWPFRSMGIARPWFPGM